MVWWRDCFSFVGYGVSLVYLYLGVFLSAPCGKPVVESVHSSLFSRTRLPVDEVVSGKSSCTRPRAHKRRDCCTSMTKSSPFPSAWSHTPRNLSFWRQSPNTLMHSRRFLNCVKSPGARFSLIQ